MTDQVEDARAEVIRLNIAGDKSQRFGQSVDALIAAASLRGRGELVSGTKPLSVASEIVLATVASHFEVTLAHIRSADRTKRVTTARQIAAWFLWREGLKLTEIGAMLNRDHSTAHHSITKIDRLQRADAQTLRDLQAIDYALREDA
ncbi:hypothetical protein LCGC14_1240910 [marine sediment metagenome]|uniref:Chromosomal replication initiator DnaA C-terminal domain-containing protein n=1 Tax=marine sediment metagenome TaxID=412755 RepID=A0A0F9LT18_9ZZZZ